MSRQIDHDRLERRSETYAARELQALWALPAVAMYAGMIPGDVLDALQASIQRTFRDGYMAGHTDAGARVR